MAGDIGASMDGGWRQCASMDGESETVAATSLGAVGRRSRCREVPEEDEAGAEKFQSQIWNTTGRWGGANPLNFESEFDQVVSDGPAVIMWTASWCRKCIYLKPKVEKLAAEFLHRRIGSLHLFLIWRSDKKSISMSHPNLKCSLLLYRQLL